GGGGGAGIEGEGEGKRLRSGEKEEEATRAAEDQLQAMSAKERQRLFAVLFPRLAGHLEAGWQLCARLPYEIDYERKAFRAPTDESVCKSARAGWLRMLIGELEGYDPDVVWCATWAAYLGGGYGADSLGVLLAAALDAGGEEGEAVFRVLKESGSNQHEIGGMGRHVTRALLVASRPDGWEYVEKMLLAAQRQEGLRQVILESIDEAHPQAFRRLLRLILDHNLIRFSATVRAVDVWFGLRWDSVSPGVIKKALEMVVTFLDDPASRSEALKKDKGEPLYLALWTLGFEDALAAVPHAAALLKDPAVERRFLAVHFLGQLE